MEVISAKRWLSWVPRTVLLCALMLGCTANADALSGAAADAAAAAAPADLTLPAPLIVLDPGHNPKQPGALGFRGVYEVDYNNAFCAGLADALRKSGFRVTLTHLPGQAIGLEDRPKFAEAAQGDLFVAIHHDSAQLMYLEKTEYHGKPAYKTRMSLSGYSIFVSEKNPFYDRSRYLAQLLGESLHELGRAPSHHHAEHIPGENRAPLDAILGIYRFDDLIVLKKTALPAVLIELGVIDDETDEAYVSNDANQQRMQHAIVNALKRYYEHAANGRKPAN